jgi:hypothetical protein
MMELKLQITPSTAKKIKALSILSDKNADQITELISGHIDTIISEEILGYVVDKNMINQVMTKTTPEPPKSKHEFYDEYFGEDSEPDESEDVDESDDEAYPEENFELAESIGGKIEEIEEEKLPEIVQKDFKEFKKMAVKDKSGEETGYEDEIMADAQAMAEGDEYEAQDSIFAAAAESFGNEKDPDVFGDDTPKEEGGIPSSTPDVLPVDLGIEKASSDKGGMDFFDKVLEGETGDKSARNKITRKRRK